MRLSSATLECLPARVERFAYDRDAQAIGIVHFGIGAFHRAHQAWYTDLAMDRGDRDWAICGVSLRSDAVSRQLAPQDGLYTVTTRSTGEEAIRVVGAVREVLFAGDDSAAIVDRIAAPECRIVSFTVTEKGYCRTGDGHLDFDQAKASFFPLLGRALARRAKEGLPGLTLLSCDNLANNGAVLSRLTREWLAERDPQALDWYEKNCTSPSSMVDRIVPRTTQGDLERFERRSGLTDDGAVFTESFSKWVIEDRFANGHPRWETVGAQLVLDVAPHETAKLRMLNGAHSLIAYKGLAAGFDFVHEAIADTRIAMLVSDLMLEEALPTIDASPSQNLEKYAEELIARFANPALRHRLSQIAMDGSQKLPQRWLETALWHLEKGHETPAIREGFDAWHAYCAYSPEVDDPAKDRLVRAARTGKRQVFLDLCFGSRGEDNALWPEFSMVGEYFG